MAGVWKGFTDEDIGFYKKNDKEKNDKFVPNKKTKNLMGSEEKKTSRDKILAKYKESDANPNNQIPEAAKLCKDSNETSTTNVVPAVKTEPKPEPEPEMLSKNESENKVEESSSSVVSSNPVCLKVIEGKAYELVDMNSADVSKATLEIFEARQKRLEEENKKKKEILAKILLARKKQTSDEAKRLQHIQEELQKLDVRLSNDVGILRDKIEAATLDFAEAQKRYNKAEKEFLDAKQNLFGKLEKKELLTKYLCTIIEHNEMRKAQKLSELMEKLEVDTVPQFDCNSAQQTKTIETTISTKQPS